MSVWNYRASASATGVARNSTHVLLQSQNLVMDIHQIYCIYSRISRKIYTKSWSKSREGDLCASHAWLVRQDWVSLPFRPSGSQRGSCVDTHTVNYCFATGRWHLPSPLQLIDGVCSLFLSLPWSASLSVERESHWPSLLSANTPTAVAELWAVTADHQLE